MPVGPEPMMAIFGVMRTRGGRVVNSGTAASSGRLRLEGELAAMFEVGDFVTANKLDHARPQPVRRIQSFRPMTFQFSGPALARILIELARVRLADDPGQKTCGFHGVFDGKTFDLNLEVLGQQLSDKDRFVSY